jgi:hypothetical protein
MEIRHITNNLMDGPRLVAAVTRISMIIFLVLTIIMWGINVWGNIGVNFAFAFVAFFLTFFILVSPKTTVPWFGLQVVSPKTAEEIHRVLLKILLSFMLTAIFLATWSFKASPWSFWALFTLLLALLTWQLINKAETDITKKLQLGYILICIALVLLKTMGVDLQNKVDASTLGKLGESVSSASSGGSAEVVASDCPASEPCVAYDGIEVQLGPNEPLVINQRQFWSKGISVRPTDPKIRATKPISSLFYLRQASDSNIVRIVPIASGFENGQPIKLVIYKQDGNADKRVAAEYGTYTPPIDITSN